MNAKLNDLIEREAREIEDNPILNGNFGPVGEEKSLTDLEVIGEIPAAISGTLLRDGPNPVDPGPNHHWFTGDGMLHAIQISNGKAQSYRNRWVRTEALEEKTGLKAAPVSDIKLLVQGSGNVNVIQHGGKILALPEIGLPYEMTSEAETVQQYDYDGRLVGSMTAHPKIDGKTGELIFFGYEVIAPFLRYHLASKEGTLVNNVDIELPKGIMMHDFGVTATRVVFMDLPVVLDLELLEANGGMPFKWSDDHQARLGVMERNSASDTVKWIDIDPCYVFHPLNSYDDGGRIVMDVVRYQKVFTSVEENNYNKGSQLVRWTIDVDAGSVETTVLSEIDQEFPRVNPRVECHKHRYGYSLETGGRHGFGGLLKFDLEAGTTERHAVGENNAGGEPVFVATGDAEDEGYIISVIYNGDTDTSEVHIIDAQHFDTDPVAIVKLGTRVPFGFHGNFVQ